MNLLDSNAAKKFYEFIPLYGNTNVEFQVKNSTQVYIALAKTPEESDEMYEIIISGEENGKSCIRRKGHGGLCDATEISISFNLKCCAFWLNLEDMAIKVGLKGETDSFISHLAYESSDLHFISIDCGNTGTWKLCSLYPQKPIELVTTNGTSYQFFRVNREDKFYFEVRSPKDAQLVLSVSPEIVPPVYGIVIGESENTNSVIWKDCTEIVASMPTPNIVNENEFQGFWISFKKNCIKVGCVNECKPFLCHKEKCLPDFFYLGVRTGPDATGTWKLYGN
uniref:Farnesoic acid O-methyl transferase domain-containing protein n=1 Tax=Glossina brevipalpis TaxID=37001 RepID=A0A1A9W1D1_9MUSC